MKNFNWGASKGDWGAFAPLVCMLKEALPFMKVGGKVATWPI